MRCHKKGFPPSMLCYVMCRQCRCFQFEAKCILTYGLIEMVTVHSYSAENPILEGSLIGTCPSHYSLHELVLISWLTQIVQRFETIWNCNCNYLSWMMDWVLFWSFVSLVCVCFIPSDIIFHSWKQKESSLAYSPEYLYVSNVQHFRLSVLDPLYIDNMLIVLYKLKLGKKLFILIDIIHALTCPRCEQMVSGWSDQWQLPINQSDCLTRNCRFSLCVMTDRGRLPCTICLSLIPDHSHW